MRNKDIHIMKWLIMPLFALLCACNKVDIPTLERHELQLIAVYDNNVIMYDITANKEVMLTYNYDLFCIDLVTLYRAYYKNEHPIFVFLCDIETLTYYRL